MTSPLRSVNVDHVNRLMEAVRIGGGFKMEKFLRVASDIGGYVPETDPRYQPDGRAGTPDDIERFEWVARWLGLKDPGGRSPVRSRQAPVHASRYHAGASVGRPGGNPRRGAGETGYLGQERSGVGPGASRMAAKNHKPAGGRTMNMNMYVYRVAEKQDSGSPGEPGEPFEAFNLSEAKRISTRRQELKERILRSIAEINEAPVVRRPE